MIIKNLIYKVLIAGVFLAATSMASGETSELRVGVTAPEFSAKNETGEIQNLKYGAGYTLVYFYPKADTPGCTDQACSLRDAYDQLSKKGVVVYGVSTDSVEDQKKFKDRYNLPFHLFSDADKKIAALFGVPVTLGFASRQAFLVKDGKIVWLDRKAATKKQAEDVLKIVNEAAGKVS